MGVAWAIIGLFRSIAPLFGEFECLNKFNIMQDRDVELM